MVGRHILRRARTRDSVERNLQETTWGKGEAEVMRVWVCQACLACMACLACQAYRACQACQAYQACHACLACQACQVCLACLACQACELCQACQVCQLCHACQACQPCQACWGRLNQASERPNRLHSHERGVRKDAHWTYVDDLGGPLGAMQLIIQVQGGTPM